MFALFGVRYCPFTDDKRTTAFLEDDVLLSEVQWAAVIRQLQTGEFMPPSMKHLTPFPVLGAVGVASACDAPLMPSTNGALTLPNSSWLCLLDKVRSFLPLCTFRTFDFFFLFLERFHLIFLSKDNSWQNSHQQRLFRDSIKQLVKLGWEIQTSRISLQHVIIHTVILTD